MVAKSTMQTCACDVNLTKVMISHAKTPSV